MVSHCLHLRKFLRVFKIYDQEIQKEKKTINETLKEDEIITQILL